MVLSPIPVSIDPFQGTHASREIEEETKRVTQAASVSHINVEHC